MTDSPHDEAALLPVANDDDLARVRSEARAFVFLWVEWAGHAFASERSLLTLLRTWRTAHPESPTPAFKVDVTDGRGEVCDAIRAWLGLEGLDSSRLIDCGTGPVLWLGRGRIVAHDIHPAIRTPAELMANTEMAFANDDDRTSDGPT